MLALTAFAWRGHPQFPFTVHWPKEPYGPIPAAREPGRWEGHLEYLVGSSCLEYPMTRCWGDEPLLHHMSIKYILMCALKLRFIPGTPPCPLTFQLTLRDPNLSSTPSTPQLSTQLFRNIWNASSPVGDVELATDGVLPILGHLWHD